MNEQTSSSKKITVGLILSWVFGILFALTGIVSVFSEPIPGIVMLAMAAVLLPPIVKLMDQKWKIHLSRGVKIGAIIIGFIIFGATVDTSNISTTQKVETQKEEQQQQQVTSEASVPQVEEEPQAESEERTTNENQTETIPPTSDKLGVSYDQMMNYLSNFFTMEKSTSVRGEDRYMSQTSSGLATLEIIGDKNNISQTSLMMGIPSDSPSAIIENSAILVRFLKNVVPEWEGSSDWATASMEKIAGSASDEEEKIYGDKKIKMSIIEEWGIITVTVKHR